MSKEVKKTFKNSALLLQTPYVGSCRSRVIHSTKNPCREVFLIEVDDRWYIRSIPRSKEYSLCPECFGDNVEIKEMG